MVGTLMTGIEMSNFLLEALHECGTRKIDERRLRIMLDKAFQGSKSMKRNFGLVPSDLKDAGVEEGFKLAAG
ncbi:hypothetical protein JCM8547_009120 [Rhodosporidiobolus lusitaniae]